MKEIVIRISLPRWRRRTWAILGTALTLVATAVVWAGPLGLVPFMPKTPTSAKDVTDNFTKLENAIVALQSRGMGTVCGYTMPTTGKVSGYAGAKQLCVTKCGVTTAHVCTPAEITAYIQAGNLLNPPNSAADVWVVSGVNNPNQDSTAIVDDCQGFTSDNSPPASRAVEGATFHNYPPWYPGYTPCHMMNPIACCN